MTMTTALPLVPTAGRLEVPDVPRAAVRRVLIWMSCALFLLFLTSGAQLRAALELFGIAQQSAPAHQPATARPGWDLSTISVDDKAQLIVAGREAEERNALIPVSHLPLGQAQRLALSSTDIGTYGTALRCLTQAVYYEAATEPLKGRRAVAQVVLNRVRHPAYPDTVCGVVYQGAERVTGCQFSFTCDGSLLRRPMAGPWREAEDVAKAALAGYVEPSVGTATYYHADYVLPKWAFQLAKIEQVGRHIFYRLPGRWGGSGAFSQRYGGFERIPDLDFAALRVRAQEGAAASQQFAQGLTVPPLVTDRHSEADVGGRLDVTKEWRLTIPDPVAASSRYRQVIATEAGAASQSVNATPATGVADAAAPAPARASIGASSLEGRPVGL